MGLENNFNISTFTFPIKTRIKKCRIVIYICTNLGLTKIDKLKTHQKQNQQDKVDFLRELDETTEEMIQLKKAEDERS